MFAKVYVTYKKEVLDPQGKAVNEALKNLNFEGVLDVRQGKYFEINLDPKSYDAKESASLQVEKMCQKLLSNPVIEDYRFELIEE